MSGVCSGHSHVCAARDRVRIQLGLLVEDLQRLGHQPRLRTQRRRFEDIGDHAAADSVGVIFKMRPAVIDIAGLIDNLAVCVELLQFRAGMRDPLSNILGHSPEHQRRRREPHMRNPAAEGIRRRKFLDRQFAPGRQSIAQCRIVRRFRQPLLEHRRIRRRLRAKAVAPDRVAIQPADNTLRIQPAVRKQIDRRVEIRRQIPASSANRAARHIAARPGSPSRLCRR